MQMTSSRWRSDPCAAKWSGWSAHRQQEVTDSSWVGEGPAPGGGPSWSFRAQAVLTAAILSRFIAQYGGSCGAAVETAGRRMVLQLETRLRESLERLRLKEQNAAAARNALAASPHLEVTLQQLLAALQAQRQAELDGPPAALAQALRSWQQRSLPAGERPRPPTLPPPPPPPPPQLARCPLPPSQTRSQASGNSWIRVGIDSWRTLVSPLAFSCFQTLVA